MLTGGWDKGRGRFVFRTQDSPGFINRVGAANTYTYQHRLWARLVLSPLLP